MQSGSYGVLAKTDGKQFVDFVLGSNKVWHGVFLDGMAFHDSIGFAMGDPKNGFFTLAFSTDCGNTWNPCEGKVEHFPDEAGFAAVAQTFKYSMTVPSSSFLAEKRVAFSEAMTEEKRGTSLLCPI
jgi:hypothetical protein